MTRIATLVVAALLCAPAAAQNIATLPSATALGGSERMLSAQGSGCAAGAQPCLAVSITPAQLANYLAPTFQQLSPNLNALSQVTTAANLCDYWTGPATANTYSCAPFGRGIVGVTSAATAQSYLGVSATGADPNYPKLVNGTDIYSNRSATSGAIFLGSNSQHYLYFDGTAYQMPGGLLSLTGNLSAAGASITAPSGAGYLNFYVGSTNVGYVAADQGSLYLASPASTVFRSNGTQVATLGSTGSLSLAGGITATSASLGAPLTIANGGTGSTSAAAGLALLGGQPLSANLNGLSGLTTNTDLCPYWTGMATVANYSCLSYGRALVGAGSAAAAQAYLGVSASGTDPAFAKLSGASFTGDIYTSRTANSGAVFFGTNGQHYIFWDGAAYQMPGGLLSLSGNLSSAGVGITAASGAGFLRFYSGSTATGYVAADTGTLYLNTPNTIQFQVNGTSRASMDSVGNITATGLALVNPLAVANGGTGDTGSPWASYTPSLSCGSGSLTSATASGKYKQIGKTVFVHIKINITTNGSCAAYIISSVPLTSATATTDTYWTLAGRERAATGKMLQAEVFNSSNTVVVFNFDNSYPGATNALLNIDGHYESN